MAALGPLKVLLCLLVLVHWNTISVSCEMICDTCYRRVASCGATVTSTTVYRSITVYAFHRTCDWMWMIQRCIYQQTASTMTVSVTRFATLYSIVYSSERYECNCVVLQPSSSTGTRTLSSASINPSSTTFMTTGTTINTKSTHSATIGIGTANSLFCTDGATIVVITSIIVPKQSIESSPISSPIATSEEQTPKEPTQPTDLTSVIIGVVIGVVVAILIVIIIIIFVGVILHIKFRKNTREYSPTQSPGKEDRVYDEVETRSETEIKNVQLESNPAYQPIAIEGSVQNPNYEEVEMKLTANPAYEPIEQVPVSETKPVFC